MSDQKFSGFEEPRENWSKLPHVFIAALPTITSLAELKCVLYVLRHTWGYQEYGTNKRITTDEFMNGRKAKDGTRMDKGTGLSKPSVIDGLERAVDHAFLVVDIDKSDLARIDKSYGLNLRDVNNVDADVKNLDSGGKKALPRTEKETSVEKPKERKDISFLWEKTTGQPAPGAILLDQLAFLLEEYGKPELTRALEAATSQRNGGKLRSVTVPYVRGILRNGGAPSKASNSLAFDPYLAKKEVSR